MIDMFLTSDEKERLLKTLNSSMNAVKYGWNKLARKKGYVWVMKKLIENAKKYNIPRYIMYNINIELPCTVDKLDIEEFYRGASIAHRTFIGEIEEIAIERVKKEYENN